MWVDNMKIISQMTIEVTMSRVPPSKNRQRHSSLNRSRQGVPQPWYSYRKSAVTKGRSSGGRHEQRWSVGWPQAAAGSEPSVVLWRLSARHGSAVLWRQRYTRTHSRNWICSETLSQWSSRISGIMGCDFFTEKTSRVAAFRIDCNLSRNTSLPYWLSRCE